MSTAIISPQGADLPRLHEQPHRLEEGGVTVAAGDPARQARPSPLPNWLKCVPFVLLHLAPLAVFWTGVDLTSLLLCAGCYLVNMVGITVGYHRYFSHRAYKTSRAFQFVLACLGCTALQKGPLWWASQHRHHHRHSDTPEDVHSPVTGGLWWSHIGWVFAPAWNEGDPKSVQDLSRYPELRWLEWFHLAPAALLAGLCFLLGSWSGLFAGFFLGNVLSHHAVFLVNSACHVWGRRRYDTPDDSRNNSVVALLTLGEGWHNNHHHYQSSANQGFFWWEIDVSYYLIRLLAALRLVWDVRKPPRAKLLDGGQMTRFRRRTGLAAATTAARLSPRADIEHAAEDALEYAEDIGPGHLVTGGGSLPPPQGMI